MAAPAEKQSLPQAPLTVRSWPPAALEALARPRGDVCKCPIGTSANERAVSCASREPLWSAEKRSRGRGCRRGLSSLNSKWIPDRVRYCALAGDDATGVASVPQAPTSASIAGNRCKLQLAAARNRGEAGRARYSSALLGHAKRYSTAWGSQQCEWRGALSRTLRKRRGALRRCRV
jgi:hypothetical protein